MYGSNTVEDNYFFLKFYCFEYHKQTCLPYASSFCRMTSSAFFKELILSAKSRKTKTKKKQHHLTALYNIRTYRKLKNQMLLYKFPS